MPNYQQGKIYKITSGDLVYVGSTTEPTLARRLSGHVADFTHWQKGKRGDVTSFRLIETGNYEITLIEAFPCSSKDELNARERFYIESMACVNKVIPCRTRKEYRDDNVEARKEINKAYYDANSKKLKDKQRAYYQANSDAVKEYQKVYCEAHSEAIKEYHKSYRAANSEVLKAKKKAYYLANKDAILERRKLVNE